MMRPVSNTLRLGRLGPGQHGERRHRRPSNWPAFWRAFWREHANAEAVAVLDQAFAALPSSDWPGPSEKAAFAHAIPVEHRLLEADAQAASQLEAVRAWMFLGELHGQLDEDEACRQAEAQGLALLEQALPGDSNG